MKDRRAGIVEMLIRWRRIFPGFDTRVANPKFPSAHAKEEKKKSKSRSKSARNWRKGKLWGNNEM